MRTFLRTLLMLLRPLLCIALLACFSIALSKAVEQEWLEFLIWGYGSAVAWSLLWLLSAFEDSPRREQAAYDEELLERSISEQMMPHQ